MKRMLVAAFAAMALAASAADFPKRPIRIIVPNPPGGTVELVARSIAPELESLGQPVIVETRPGGNSIIGLDAVARAPADGHTLVMATTAIVTLPLLAKPPFGGLEAFAPVAGLASTPNVFVVHPSVTATTLKELVSLSQATSLNCAASLPASAINLAAERFKRLAHADLNLVPYQGGVQTVQAVVAGHATVGFAPVSDAAPHLASGKLRAIAVSSAERYDLIRDVPTIAESGYPGFQAVQWFGVAAPAGTPAAVVEKLSAVVLRGLERPEVRARFAALGIQPMPMGSRRFAEFLRAETATFSEIVRTTGIRLE